MAERGETAASARTEEATDSDDGSTVFTERAKAGIVIAALGVAVPGLADNLLTQAGAPGIGALVFALGFGSAVVAFWYVVLRPIDFGAETEA
ncbi:hypothetical protein [Halomarina rubra]|uniref:Uncharacterized protein n=1 Tax=Halomarina rubra TaxID=2071873 RepID=A0ABD6AY35_9EURY|nr:hypothetical protein [Halomarina rubra]